MQITDSVFMLYVTKEYTSFSSLLTSIPEACFLKGSSNTLQCKIEILKYDKQT
jgi:hypothetical protein